MFWTCWRCWLQNDDLFVRPNLLSKILLAKHSSECTSRKQAKTWISSAVAAGLVVEYKMNKNKHICLARLNNEAVSPFPPDSVDTTLEEDFETSCRTRPEVASLD